MPWISIAMIAVMGLGNLPPVQCLQASADLRAETVARSADFSLSPCPSTALAAAFHHDAVMGGSRLSRSIAMGEIVRAFPEYGRAMIHPGDPLRIVLQVGNVRFERAVVALQAARSGKRLFVRANDGSILSARYEGAP